MKDFEILMLDKCTESEAKKYLKKGTVVFESEDFENHFDDYMDEWDISEEDRNEFKAMIDEKKPVTDWSIVEHDDKIYYIMYAL